MTRTARAAAELAAVLAYLAWCFGSAACCYAAESVGRWRAGRLDSPLTPDRFTPRPTDRGRRV